MASNTNPATKQPFVIDNHLHLTKVQPMTDTEVRVLVLDNAGQVRSLGVENLPKAGSKKLLLSGAIFNTIYNIDGSVAVPLFSAAISGIVPASGGGTTNFLRSDGTWAVPAGGSGPTSGNGTTVVGSAVNIGGNISANISSIFSGNFSYNIGGGLAGQPTLALTKVGATWSSAELSAWGNAGVSAQLIITSNGPTPQMAFLVSGTQWLSMHPTGMVFILGSDAGGDMWYRGAGGFFTRLPLGSALQVLRVNAGATAPEWAAGGAGTVTSVSVVTANGFAGSVATATTTPAITITTTITGILKGNSTAISAATVGADYSVGTASLATGLLKSTTTTGALSIAVAGTDYLVSNQSITLSGDISGVGSTAITTTIGANKVTLGMMATIATATFLGRTTAGTGNVEALTVAQSKTLLNLTGTNSGDQTITLTGDVTGSGTSSFATAIGANKVTLAMMATIATSSFLGRITAGTGNVEVLTATQATSLLNNFTTTLNGLVPFSGGGTTNFLRADGNWAAPAGGSGTVTSVSVVSANGFSGSVATATTTPAITITTTITGILKGNGTAISAATSGVDYSTITNAAASNELMKSDGTNATASGLFSVSGSGNLQFGSASQGGGRSITTVGSNPDVDLTVTTQGGTSNVKINNIDFASGGTGVVFNAATTTMFWVGDAYLQSFGAIAIGGVSGTTAPNVSIAGNGGTVVAGKVLITGGQSTTTGIAAGDVFIRGGDATVGNADSGNIFIDILAKAGSGKYGNVALFSSTGSFGGGEKVLFIANPITIPSTSPVAGSIYFPDPLNDSRPAVKTPVGYVFDLTGPSMGKTTAITMGMAMV